MNDVVCHEALTAEISEHSCVIEVIELTAAESSEYRCFWIVLDLGQLIGLVVRRVSDDLSDLCSWVSSLELGDDAVKNCLIFCAPVVELDASGRCSESANWLLTAGVEFDSSPAKYAGRILLTDERCRCGTRADTFASALSTERRRIGSIDGYKW